MTKCEDESEKREVPEVNGDDGSALAKSNLKGDWLNFFLLLLLYTMQGLPLGISSAIPVLLQSKKNVSYQEQVKITNCNNHRNFVKSQKRLSIQPSDRLRCVFYFRLSLA